MVDLVGIEPTTFPAQPGRTQARFPEMSSTIERCDFQIFSLRSRRRASPRVG